MLNKVYKLISPKEIKPTWQEITLNTNNVVIRPDVLSICAADLRYFLGNRAKEVLNQKLPLALIHEGIGSVVYDPSGYYSKGDRVVMLPNIENESSRDNHIKGNYRKDSVFLSSSDDGFMQDLISLPHNNIILIPKDISEDEKSLFVFTEMISVIVNAIETIPNSSALTPPTFAVWGDGVMGFIAGLVVKSLYPSSPIYIVGKHKRKLDLFSYSTQTYFTHEIPDDFSPDVVFECVGGTASEIALDEIVKYISPQGKIALLGVSENKVSIPTRLILEKGIHLTGCSRSERNDFLTAVKLISSNNEFRNYLTNLISTTTNVYNEKDMIKAFELAHIKDFKVLINWMV